MTTVLKQGEEYEEDEVLEDYDEEGSEDTEAKLTTIAGIPIKFLVIGGAVLLLLLIGVIVFSLHGSGDDDIVMPEEQVEAPQDVAQTPVAQTQPTSTPIEQQPAQSVQQGTDTSTQKVIWMDSTGAIAGFTNGSAEGIEVRLNDSPIGTLSYSTGTPVTSDTGISAFISGNSSTTASTETTESSDDILTKLRALGYTGDEIEAAKSSGADLNAMVKSAEKLRDEEAKEALVRMSDSASEEFQQIVNHSIFCLPEVKFPETRNEPGRIVKENSFTVNADYEKLETLGHQLFVKLKIANSTYAFMAIEPKRWAAIPDTGNMVVRVNYTLFGMDNEYLQFYITSIEELDVSQITVNPEDSATNIEDIIDTQSASGSIPVGQEGETTNVPN